MKYLLSAALLSLPTWAYASVYELTPELEGKFQVFLDWSLMAIYYGLKIFQ